MWNFFQKLIVPFNKATQGEIFSKMNERTCKIIRDTRVIFWWNFWFYACDQKLLLVTFNVKSYLGSNVCYDRYQDPWLEE